jgi:hypothetical protein
MDRTGIRPLESRPNLSGHNNVSVPGSGHIVQRPGDKKCMGQDIPDTVFRDVLIRDTSSRHRPRMGGEQGMQTIGKGSYSRKYCRKPRLGMLEGGGGDRMQS